SDFPVESPDPRAGLYAARTRQDASGNPPGGWMADQALSGAEALAAFTAGAAYAAREEEERGARRVGVRAGGAGLDVDPVKCDPPALLHARVLRVLIDGKSVYEPKETSP